MKADKSIRKLLTKSPQETIARLSAEQSTDSTRESLQLKGDELQQLLVQKHRLTDDQKRTSRQIGQAKKEQADISDFLTEMNTISGNLKSTNSSINAILDDLVAIISMPAETSAPTNSNLSESRPAHFHPNTVDSSAAELTLEYLEACSTSEWTEYVKRHPNSSIYHDAKWAKLIEDNFKHKSYRLAAKDSNGQLRGILPLVHLNSRLFGSFLVSMPYFNYGGPLADNPAIAEQLMQKSAELAKRLSGSHVEIRESNGRSGWPVRTEKVSMTRALPETSEQLMAQFGAKLRSQIKRPAKYNASIAFGGIELLDDFYLVFSRRMRSLGTPVYSKQFFKDILTTYPEHAFIAAVTVAGKPVAAGFLLGYRDTLEIPWAASYDNEKYPCINMFLYGNVLEEALRRQYAFFDFGRSTIDGATYRFKKQWGATPQPLYWHYWLQDGNEPPSMNPNNPKYRYAILAWRRLPLWLTQLLGPPIVKNLP